MPAAALAKAGFNAAYLSLAHRPATPEETEAYTALSHKAGRTLKCVIAVDEKCMVAAVKGSRGLEDFGIMPAILAKARLEHPALPKLLRGTAWYSGREGVYLFDKIEQLSPNLKAVLCTHLINTETVLMSDFAEKASALQCDDRVVLASGLREHWVFASRNRDWRATISDSSWKVALSSENDVLSIELESHDDEYILQLSPYERQPDLRPYGGFLSSLLPFMQQLQALKEFGLDARWAYALANEGEGRSPRGRGEWFATLISEMMHGINGPTHLLRVMNCGLDWDLEQWDGTSWPCFEFDERDVAI